MAFPLALLLGALKFAPAVLGAGREIVEAVTGESVSEKHASTPEALTDYVGALSEEQQAEITSQVLDAKTRYQELDTQRFVAMVDGDVEKLRASARPEIAKRAMDTIAIFGWTFRLMIIAAIGDYLLRLVAAAMDKKFPVETTLMGSIADVAPAAEMIWAPLIASFWVCAEIIKKYFGCRERDKAIEYEMRAGKELGATQATIEAAGTGIAGIVKAWKGR